MTQLIHKSQFKRVGPRPLGLHVALLCAKSLPKTDWSDTKNNDFSYILKHLPHQRLESAFKNTAMQSFLQGVEIYRNATAERVATPYTTISRLWDPCSVELRDFGGTGRKILLIPSLINPSYVLDFNSGCSLVSYLKKQNFHVFMLDWGDENSPSSHRADLTLEKCIDFYINLSVKYIAQKGANSPTGTPSTPHTSTDKIDILGYCMGGLLALCATSKWPQYIRQLALVASPWDFSKTEHSQHFKSAENWLNAFFSGCQDVSVDLLQSAFVALDPMSAINRFSALNNVADKTQKERLILIEDWLASGLPLPKNIAKEMVSDWYVKNAPSRGCWHVGQHILDTSLIQTKTLIVAPKSDKIVPFECSSPLATCLPNAQLYSPNSGHIGVMVGRKSETLYRYITNWFNDNQAD